VNLPVLFVASLGVLVLTAIVPATLVQARVAQSEVVGHVYVNLNTATENSIAAFNRHADGTLTSMAGSPFMAGGAGTGDTVGSQDALRMTPDGRYLLAVDAGSHEVSVLSIGDDGSLSPVTGSPFASGGQVPVSIAIHEDLIYVANRGNGTDGANFTGFRLGADGVLSPLDGSTVPVSATANLGAVFFNATGTNLVGTEIGPDEGPFLIDSFTVGTGGLLTPAPGSPFTAQAEGPYAGAFRPTKPQQLYIVNAHAGPNHGSVSAYDVAGAGVLQSIPGSPYPNRQTAPCWMDMTPDGRYLFTINTATSSISRYGVQDDGSLKLLGNVILNDPTNLRAIDARIDPEGGYLYVLGADAGIVTVLAVENGNLTELSAPPASLPDGATPFGIAVT
jgi:6-phosphogluconolactonase (cycloisomerase 2 family)